MDHDQIINCTSKKHKELNAISYCQECGINMCNKCQNYHSELFADHHIYNIDKNIKEIFTGFCKNKNHNKELKYFCKDHNKLCCAVCLCKIKDEADGYHNNCEVCLIKDIEKEKRIKLKENLKWLEEISINLEQSIKLMKDFGEKLDEQKEKLKLNVQNIFTKIRNEINNREDELLKEIDKRYEKLFLDENMIKSSEKLPIKIKNSLENGKMIEKEWDKNKLSSLINECINIENNIKDINLLNDGLKKFKDNENKLEIEIKEEDIKSILDKINILGNIYEQGKFRFKFQEGRNYTLDKDGLVAKKTGGGNTWNCSIIGNKEIPKNKISTWKIKLNNFCIKNNTWKILIGIGPKNEKNVDYFYNYCWSFICGCSKLSNKSGSEYNYNNHTGKLKQDDIVEVIADRKKGDLTFAVNNINYGSTNIKIPENEELYPIVLICDQGQIVEIV